jgi:hypothetical protein
MGIRLRPWSSPQSRQSSHSAKRFSVLLSEYAWSSCCFSDLPAGPRLQGTLYSLLLSISKTWPLQQVQDLRLHWGPFFPLLPGTSQIVWAFTVTGSVAILRTAVSSPAPVMTGLLTEFGGCYQKRERFLPH